MRRPWPSKRDRKKAVARAEDELNQRIRERGAVEATIGRLRAARESNHFRERFEAALRGS